MTITTAYKTQSSQMGSVLRRLNPLISLLLRSPLHGVMSKTCILLSFKGRKSGTTYTFPVGYFKHEGETLTLVPLHPWWKNLQDNVSVTIWFKGRKYAAVANASQGDDTTVRELAGLIERSSTLMRVFKIECDAQRQANTTQLNNMARRLALVKVQMTERSQG